MAVNGAESKYTYLGIVDGAERGAEGNSQIVDAVHGELGLDVDETGLLSCSMEGAIWENILVF